MINKPLDFYVKWAATILALVHVYFIANDVAPYYKWTGITQAALWFWLGILWRQPSFLILNGIMMAMYLHGILK